MDRALLDTDTLSGIMRQNPGAINYARSYLAIHGRFTISLITRYEILRGLKAKNATKQLLAFDVFCASLDVLPLTDEVIVRASTIYAELRKNGVTIGDADILIAATAQESKLVLVTNNTKHYGRITDLQLGNWLVL